MFSLHGFRSSIGPVAPKRIGVCDTEVGGRCQNTICRGRSICVRICWAASVDGCSTPSRGRGSGKSSRLDVLNSAVFDSDLEDDEPSTSSSGPEKGETLTALGRLLKQRRARESATPGGSAGLETPKLIQKSRKNIKENVLFSSAGFETPKLIPKSRKNNKDDVLFSSEAREIINGEIQKTDKEEVYLRKYLKVRRDNVAEVLKISMREAKFSPTYTNDVVSTMPSFIDHVLVQAVGLKKDPRYKALNFKQRAKLFISQTGVIPLIRTLKHNRLTISRIGYLLCEASDRLDIILPRLECLKSVHVRGRDIGVVLTRVPRVLEEPVHVLQETADFLEQSGVKKEWIGTVISRAPGVLAISRQELHERVQYFRDFGMSPEQYGAMVFNFPAVLGKFSLEEIRPKVDCLTGILSDHNAVVRVIAERPQLLACSVEEDWTPLIKYFYFLGIDIFGIRRILACNPAAFCLNIQENIAPKVRFLKAIGVEEQVIGQVLVKFPALFSYSLDKKIRPLVRFLLERVGVPEEHVGKVVASRPDYFGNSIPNKLEPVVGFFKAIGLKPAVLGPMVVDFPLLLKYNHPILHPKYRYLKRVMLRPLAEVVAFPRYFSYSLPGRIIPRHKILAKKGLRFTLRYMLACTDSIFTQRVEAAERGDIPDDAVVPDTPEYSNEVCDGDSEDEQWEEEYEAPQESDLEPEDLWDASEAYLRQLESETNQIDNLK